MMKSKAYILLGVLFAAILICSTAVAQKPEDEKNSEKVNEANNEVTADVKEPEQYGRPRCRYGCCRWRRYGYQRCCRTEHEAKETSAASGDGKKVAGTSVTVNP